MRADLQVAIIVVVGVLAAVGLGVATGLITVSPEPTPMDRACMDTFGEDWHSSGYAAVSIPPTIHCAGPDGQLGLMPMPEDIRADKNIVLANETGGT